MCALEKVHELVLNKINHVHTINKSNWCTYMQYIQLTVWLERYWA